MDYINKIVIVIGGNGGFGFEVVCYFVWFGVRVIIVCCNVDSG